MRLLSKEQFRKMNEWMQSYARPYDIAKWNYLFNGGRKEEIVKEMLKYQNPDGGFGKGFESDILYPNSNAISTAEAIFQAYEYDLDCNSEWFQNILLYFETTVQDIPKYWEDFPKEALNFPHAPWWNLEPNTIFNPNPCGVVASALIRYGTEAQKKLGFKIVNDCFNLLKSSDFCGDHDSLNILILVEQLLTINSSLVTDEIVSAMKRRITENTCFDKNKWNEYYFQPLGFISSPNSIWYDTVKIGIEENIDFWLDSINNEGVWEPNFSWGIDSDVSRQVTQNWKGYIAVNRARILKNFVRIEE